MTKFTLFIGQLKHVPNKYDERKKTLSSFKLSVRDFIVKTPLYNNQILEY